MDLVPYNMLIASLIINATIMLTNCGYISLVGIESFLGNLYRITLIP